MAPEDNPADEVGIVEKPPVEYVQVIVRVYPGIRDEEGNDSFYEVEGKADSAICAMSEHGAVTYAKLFAAQVVDKCIGMARDNGHWTHDPSPLLINPRNLKGLKL